MHLCFSLWDEHVTAVVMVVISTIEYKQGEGEGEETKRFDASSNHILQWDPYPCLSVGSSGSPS